MKKQIALKKKPKPRITDFEIGLLQEFIHARFGLKRKETAHEVLVAKATRESEQRYLDSINLSKMQDKPSELNDRSLYPDVSFMSDRNPYLVDFSKSFKNHGKEIIESIQNNPRFLRKQDPVEEKENQPVIVQEVVKEIKPAISASALDMIKCKDIIKTASLMTLKHYQVRDYANEIKNKKNIILPKLTPKDAAGLEELKQSLNLNISQVTIKM